MQMNFYAQMVINIIHRLEKVGSVTLIGCQ